MDAADKDHPTDSPNPPPTEGRDAPSPTKMPLSGWKQVLLRVKNEFAERNVSIIAAGVAFYWLLAISPALAAGVSIWAIFADPAEVTTAFEELGRFIPEDAAAILGSQLSDVASAAGGALGFGAVVGILFSLWSANAGMKSLMSGLNVVWDTDEDRGFLALNLQSFGLLACVLVFAAVTVGSFAALPILQSLGLAGTVGAVLVFVRWPALALLAIVLVAVIYRYGPSRPPPHWRWISPGAVLAMGGFLLVSMGFSIWASHFGSYQETYGSLAGIVVTLLWLWLSAVVVLLGGELDAELERQTVHPTRVTDGPPATPA